MEPANLAQAFHRYGGTSIGLCCPALIVVVEATNFRHRDHLTTLWRLYWASSRAIHPQRQVRAPRVVIGQIAREDAPEVVLTQHDDVVQAFAANTPDETLHIGVLPGTPRRDHDVFDPHVLHPLPKEGPIDTVAIAPQIPRRLVPRKGLDYLLRSPLGGEMLGHANTDRAPAMTSEHQEDEQHLVRHRGDHEEIEGDQVPDLLGDGRAAWLPTPAQPGPVVTETFALPGLHRTWLDEDQGILPT